MNRLLFIALCMEISSPHQQIIYIKNRAAFYAVENPQVKRLGQEQFKKTDRLANFTLRLRPNGTQDWMKVRVPKNTVRGLTSQFGGSVQTGMNLTKLKYIIEQGRARDVEIAKAKLR